MIPDQGNFRFFYDNVYSDLYIFESYDHLLHQSLIKIFLQCCANSEQTKELIRDQNLLIELILDQEPMLNNQFPKNNFEKFSLLWIAVLSGYYKSAELLVRCGADVNEPFGSRNYQMMDKKWTILHVLLQMQSSSEINRLISLIMDHGADWKTQDSYGRTILHFATKHNWVQLTETLLEKGADVNVADKDGETPLLTAASSKEASKLLPLLMKYGADVTVNCSSNCNALHRLAFNSDNHAAHVAMAKILIEKGVSLEEREVRNLYQPIHLAVMSGNDEFVKLCLDRGINVNSRTKDGESALHLAIRWHITSPAVLETLLKSGADINLRTFEGRTALHVACERVKDEIIQLLLSAGANMLVEDHNGDSPFTLINREMCRNGMEIEHNSIIRLMIKHLAFKNGCLPSILLKDEYIIMQYPKLWNYYKDCGVYVSRMKFTSFFKNFTFYDLLTKSQRQIVALMRHPGFEANFRMYDLEGFKMYADDILQAFERGSSVLEMEEVVNDAAHGILPWMVVRQVVSYMLGDS